MLGVRRLLVAAVVAGAILVGAGTASLLVPATSTAACAGCAQYTNPLGTSTQSASQTASQTTSAPVTQTTAPPSTTPASTGTVAPAAPATVTDPEPTATAAAAGGSGSTTSGPSLPHTGYDSWTVFGFGIVLVGGGLFVRRRIRRT